MKVTQNQVLVGIVLVAISFAIGGAIMFDRAEADLTDQEVYEIILRWHDDNGHLFASQKELKDTITLLDKQHHEQFMGVDKNFTSIAKVLDNHNTQLIVLRAQAQISIPDVSQGTGDFDLKTINIQTFQITETFPQAMPVYITGKYDGTSNKIDYDIYKSGILYATGNPSITAGTFTFAYNVNGNAEKGEYTVTVIIDNKKDTISFEIE